MKKRGLLFFIFALLLLGCVNKEKMTLNEFQVVACETASEHGTCSKLNDLGLVSNSECCAVLGRCCNFKITGYVLSDLEITMCDAAQEGGTCDKLAELGMVTKEECCSELGECCTTTQTCDQTGGSCKDNTCGSYSDCSSISGSCTTGYCCSGACMTPAQTCSQAGGSCKDSTCGSYSDCAPVSGSCTTGYCCTGTCNIPTLTCSQAGGSCKDNTCNYYSDCTPVSGNCTSGYCCSGSCTTTITTEVCSSDIECAQCGDACILKTQWSSSCASPTISFDCKCISNSCTLILKEAEKTMLPDCTITCMNQNGCVCLSDCQTAGETTYGMNCGGEKFPTIKEVSLCDGCMVGTTCLKPKVQKQTAEGGSTFYCGEDKKLGWVKNVNESCSQDYECFSYLCKDGMCVENPREAGKDFKLVIIIGGAIVFAGLVFLVFRLLSSGEVVKEKKGKAEKEGVSKKEEGIEKREFNIPRYKYEYKPELDVLEKKLKESLKRLKKYFK